MDNLPLFPLDAVLFPGTPIFLHIFEPRYKQLVKHCLETGQPFGVVLIRKGVEASGPLPEPHAIGCSARIVSIEKLDDGRMNLVAMGDERFQITSLDYSTPYLTGQVESIPLEGVFDPDFAGQRQEIMSLVQKYAGILKSIGAAGDEITEIGLPENDLTMLYFSAALLQIPAIEKQPLLTAPTANVLQSILLRLYKREASVLPGLNNVGETQASRAALLN